MDDQINDMLSRAIACWVNHAAAAVCDDARDVMGGITHALDESVDLEVIIRVKAGTALLTAVNSATKKRLVLHREAIPVLAPIGPQEGTLQ